MAFVLSLFVPHLSFLRVWGKLCLIIVAFPGYVHLYLCVYYIIYFCTVYFIIKSQGFG